MRRFDKTPLGGRADPHGLNQIEAGPLAGAMVSPAGTLRWISSGRSLTSPGAG